MELNELSGAIVNAAFKVHTALGPGLLESAYEACLMYELRELGIEVDSQVPLPVIYRDIKIEAGYRLDLLVGNEIIVELKSVEKVLPIHEAQLLSYLRISGKSLGLLLNFNVLHMKDGLKRLVNHL